MKSLLDLIADIPTNAALRKEVQALEKKIAELEQKCAGLEGELRQAKEELAAKTVTADFVEHRGAVFKRRPEGGYYDDVLCRNCRHPMLSFVNVHPYRCTSCNVAVNFNGTQLPMIMSELAQRTSP